jgi:hypothetical protein
MVVVLVFVIASVAIGATFIAKTLRSRVTPHDLRGDWWPRFESEFRDYARQSASGRHSRGRHDTPPR